MALKVNASGQASVTDVYDEIFNVKDGRIWNRKYGYLGAADETYKEQLYALSKKAAWNMWVNNPDKAVIKGTELEKEAELILGENREGELTELLRRFSMVRHSEGRAETEFIHRSIYEYFAALNIFDAIRDYLQDETDIPDEVTAELAKLMSVQELSSDIEGHLEKLVEKRKPADKCKEGWQNWFGQRLRNGMRPAETNVGGLIWIKREINCFQNYIKLLRPILGRNTDNKYCKLWRDDDTDAVGFMGRYIRYTASLNRSMVLHGLDLTGVGLFRANLILADLRDANLCGAYLRGAYLHHVNLRGANLHGGKLYDANLGGARLIDANLGSTNLRNANLRGANLNGANLNGADLSDANLRGANLRNTNLKNTIILKSELKDVHYYPREMEKAILLNDDLTPVYPLSDAQKEVLRYHRIRFQETYPPNPHTTPAGL